MVGYENVSFLILDCMLDTGTRTLALERRSTDRSPSSAATAAAVATAVAAFASLARAAAAHRDSRMWNGVWRLSTSFYTADSRDTSDVVERGARDARSAAPIKRDGAAWLN